jgi:DNA-binding HxlR family transcriptional regulator
MFDGSDHRCDRRPLDALILRECFLRTRRFEGFQSALGITRHLLAERLKKLVRQGVCAAFHIRNRPNATSTS